MSLHMPPQTTFVGHTVVEEVAGEPGNLVLLSHVSLSVIGRFVHAGALAAGEYTSIIYSLHIGIAPYLGVAVPFTDLAGTCFVMTLHVSQQTALVGRAVAYSVGAKVAGEPDLLVLHAHISLSAMDCFVCAVTLAADEHTFAMFSLNV